jgi:hypothetical protein
MKEPWMKKPPPKQGPQSVLAPKLVFMNLFRMEFRWALDSQRSLGRQVEGFIVALRDEFVPGLPLFRLNFT